MNLTIKRIEDNYISLNSLYKQGKFEDYVETTEDKDSTKFFPLSPEKLETSQKFTSEITDESRGKKRNSEDLQWATRNLREQAQHLFENYESNHSLSSESISSLILHYYRIIALSYEVDDYFLDVSDETSEFLIPLTRKITNDIDAYLDQFKDYFPDDSEEYWELIKQILIVVLCGVNEFYRKHQYKDGLEKVKFVKEFLIKCQKRTNKLEGRWFGLKGLCSFITGKLYTVLSEFDEAEKEFSNSVEAYSESIWQKERPRQTKAMSSQSRIEKIDSGEYEISRSVALRRIGLVTSFGYAFQSLVLGKVKDAIRLSSIARGIVNWNTGKIWSAYVDLIYFSAKRAEMSSDFDYLHQIKKNLERCHSIFIDLIPTGHYKNRALFQIALVDHYLARWHKEKGEELFKSDNEEAMVKFNLARIHWNYVTEKLMTTINDPKLTLNKRLRAESMAIVGHALGNLGLLAKVFGENGSEKFTEANKILKNAWVEAADYPQIRCEVGLAKAAVSKGYVEYLRGNSSNDGKLEVNEILKTSFQVLHEVLHLNKNSSIRIEATAYLRLTEFALMEEDTRILAYNYFNMFKEISSRVEHEFCHRWAHELEREMLLSHTFTIRPGMEFTKKEIDDELKKYFADYAIYHAAIKIEKDFLANGKFNKNDSISSYLKNELSAFGLNNFNKVKELYNEHNMFKRVRQISLTAGKLSDYYTNEK